MIERVIKIGCERVSVYVCGGWSVRSSVREERQRLCRSECKCVWKSEGACMCEWEKIGECSVCMRE